jgi:hypothetical protein
MKNNRNNVAYIYFGVMILLWVYFNTILEDKNGQEFRKFDHGTQGSSKAGEVE